MTEDQLRNLLNEANHLRWQRDDLHRANVAADLARPIRLQGDIGVWCDSLWPGFTTGQRFLKFNEEFIELGLEVRRGNKDAIRLEAADCGLVLMSIAYREGFDLIEEIRSTFPKAQEKCARLLAEGRLPGPEGNRR